MLNIRQILKATGGKLLNGSEDTIVKNYIIDSRNVKNDDFFIPIVGNNNDGHNYILNCVEKGIIGYFIESSFNSKEEIISKSKIIDDDICIVEISNSEEALYKIGEYNRNLHMNIPVVAVTGSVGKTSTREMISSILSKKFNILTTYKNYNGYIGLSLMLLKLDNQEIAILEHGIDKIGEMDLLSNSSRPNVAVITMIGTAHIGMIGSQEKIFEEKLNIARNMNKSDLLILNGDDKYLGGYSNDNINCIKYKMVDANNIKIDENSTEFETKIYDNNYKIKLNTVGEHNIYNVLASIKVAEKFDVRVDDIIKGIEEYKNLSRRFEKIILKNNIQIIDDTYNASIDSMKSGIKSISIMKANRKLVILGDMLELGNYSDSLHLEVGKAFEDVDVDILFTLGEQAKLIAQEAKKHVKEVYEFSIRKELIEELSKVIKKDDLIYFKASNGMKFDEIIGELKILLENK